MRMMRCTLGQGSELSVRFFEFGRQFSVGSVADFDEVVGSREVDGHARQVTIADLLEGRHDAFEPVTPPGASQATVDVGDEVKE